jgi:hypothetical protein
MPLRMIRQDLDTTLAQLQQAADAQNPGGPNLALCLRPACHPKASILADYVGYGLLWLRCNRCKNQFASILVSKQPYLA